MHRSNTNLSLTVLKEKLSVLWSTPELLTLVKLYLCVMVMAIFSSESMCLLYGTLPQVVQQCSAICERDLRREEIDRSEGRIGGISLLKRCYVYRHYQMNIEMQIEN